MNDVYDPKSIDPMGKTVKGLALHLGILFQRGIPAPTWVGPSSRWMLPKYVERKSS